MQLNDLEESFRLERSHMEEEILRKEMKIRKMREAHEESQRQRFRNSGIERSETQNQTRPSNEEQQQQQALYDHPSSNFPFVTWHHPISGITFQHLLGGLIMALCILMNLAEGPKIYLQVGFSNTLEPPHLRKPQIVCITI